MAMSKDLEPTRSGMMAALFGNGLERQHRGQLDRMGLEADLTEESIGLVHQAGRTSIEETSMTAAWRDAAMQRDPEFAQVYAQMWYEVAQAGQSLVRGLPRRLR